MTRDSVDLIMEVPSEASNVDAFKHAVLLGNMEEAIQMCIQDDRWPEALILASCEDVKLEQKVQRLYFQKYRDETCKLIQSIVCKDWRRLVEECDLKYWESVLITVLANVGNEGEVAFLAGLLGKRLEDSDDEALVNDSFVCYLCTKNMDNAKELSWWNVGDDTTSDGKIRLQNVTKSLNILRKVSKSRTKESKGRGALNLSGDSPSPTKLERSNWVSSQGSLNSVSDLDSGDYIGDSASYCSRDRVQYLLNSPRNSSHGMLSQHQTPVNSNSVLSNNNDSYSVSAPPKNACQNQKPTTSTSATDSSLKVTSGFDSSAPTNGSIDFRSRSQHPGSNQVRHPSSGPANGYPFQAIGPTATYSFVPGVQISYPHSYPSAPVLLPPWVTPQPIMSMSASASAPWPQTAVPRSSGPGPFQTRMRYQHQQPYVHYPSPQPQVLSTRPPVHVQSTVRAPSESVSLREPPPTASSPKAANTPTPPPSLPQPSKGFLSRLKAPPGKDLSNFGFSYSPPSVSPLNSSSSPSCVMKSNSNTGENPESSCSKLRSDHSPTARTNYSTINSSKVKPTEILSILVNAMDDSTSSSGSTQSNVGMDSNSFSPSSSSVNEASSPLSDLCPPPEVFNCVDSTPAKVSNGANSDLAENQDVRIFLEKIRDKYCSEKSRSVPIPDDIVAEVASRIKYWKSVGANSTTSPN